MFFVRIVILAAGAALSARYGLLWVSGLCTAGIVLYTWYHDQKERERAERG